MAEYKNPKPTVDVLIVNYLTGNLARKAVGAVRGDGVGVHVWDNSGELLTDRLGLDDRGRPVHTLVAEGGEAERR